MSTSLEHVHEEHVHELEPHIRVGRARAAVIMFIISDVLAVFAILAAGSYLRALNTENQFRTAGDHLPAFLPGLLVMIGLVLSGLTYYWWESRIRVGRGEDGGRDSRRLFLTLSLALMFVAAVGQTWIAVVLNRAYTTPYDAYESLITLLIWSTAIHLVLTFILGLLLFGRATRGRLAGQEYLAGALGYWWYYTILASLLMWLFSLLI